MRHIGRWSLLVSILLVFNEEIIEHAAQVLGQAGDGVDLAAVVRSLGALVAAPSFLAFSLFSRIDESRTLESGSRQRLREAIRASPGASLSELSARAGLGWGTTVYHLNRMESAGLVSSTDIGRRRAFFLAEHDVKVRDMTRLVANDAQHRLLLALGARPGSSQRELAAAAGLSLPLANRYLQRLEALGMLRSTKVWRERRYEATERLQAGLQTDRQRKMSLAPTLPVVSSSLAVPAWDKRALK